MKTSQSRGAERRRCQRIPVAIPVFVRGSGNNGEKFTEFTTLLNISAGGALILIRHDLLSPRTRLAVEIPAAPMPQSRTSRRQLSGDLVRVQELHGLSVCGLRFATPLLEKERRSPKI